MRKQHFHQIGMYGDMEARIFASLSIHVHYQIRLSADDVFSYIDRQTVDGRTYEEAHYYA